MQFTFYKYQGTGNDFVILDNRDAAYDAITPKQVKFICDRRFGIGADGLMLLNLREGYDFEMIYTTLMETPAPCAATVADAW